MTQARARGGDTIAAGGMLAVALLLGGGSALFPVQRLFVELVAVLVLGWFCMRPWQLPRSRSVKLLAAMILVALALMVVQLIPLSASFWQGLPGRADQLAVYSALGEAGRSAPISLYPAGTRDTIAFFLVPVAMFVAALRVDREGQRLLLQIVAAFCMLNALLVVLQFQGLSWLSLYTSYGRPGTGLFANKNHSAVFLVAAMPAVAMVVMEARHDISLAARRGIAVALTAFLALTVFGCLSRAGLALLPIGLALCVVMIAPRGGDWRRTASAWAGVGVVVLLLLVVLPRTTVGAQALARFDAQGDLRYQFWPVVIEAVKANFPVGSGFGTFQPVFAAMEPLSIVKPTFVNHAHSDYMEIALEGGIVGVLLMIGFVAWFSAAAVARLLACRPGRAGFPVVAIAVAGITELLLHSIIDYPLRTLALSSLAGVYVAILATRPTVLDFEEPSCYRRSARRRARRETGRDGRVSSLREFR